MKPGFLTWARSTVADPKFTTYTYTQGMMTATDYSDTTPDITIEYDALGRPATQSTPIAKSTYTYNPATLLLDTETISYNLDGAAGYEFTRTLDRSQDTLLRDSGWELKNATTIENKAGYQYSATTGRLEKVLGLASPSLASSEFTYTYEPNSNLIKTITAPAHTVTNTYEPNRNTLDTKENKASTTLVSKYDYTVNAIGQRTHLAQTGTAFDSARDLTWGYDDLGQVTSADSTIPGLDRAYQFDLIGNRLKTADSLTLPTANNYAANALNQYTTVNAVNPSHDPDGNNPFFPAFGPVTSSFRGLPQKANSLQLNQPSKAKAGPPSRLENIFEKVSVLPRSKQKVVADMLEGFLDKTVGA